MNTPTPTNALPPTMRVAVELTFVRDCADCRAVAERTAIAAIHDKSVTGIRVVPGTKHAHAVETQSGASQRLEGGSNATAGDSVAQNALFDAIPHSDTNGFDPQERA